MYANFNINDIKQIDVKKDEELIRKLKKKVIDDLWDNKDDITVIEENLDFIHKNFESFLLAKSYKFNRQDYEDSDTLFSWIMGRMGASNKLSFMPKPSL